MTDLRRGAPAVDVHRAPRTAAEREELLRLIRDQYREIADDTTQITCAGCGRRVAFRVAFRCYFCALVFCRPCAGTHFDLAGELPRLPARLPGLSVWDLVRARRRVNLRQARTRLVGLGGGQQGGRR